MKFKIVRSKFLDGLKKVQSIAPTKATMIIIQNVLLEARDNQLQLTTTDLDISIKTSVPCEVEESGSTTMPVKLLFNSIAKAADGVIEVNVNAADQAEIVANTATFRLVGMPVIDYPTLPEDSNSFEYIVPQAVLREMLRKTSYAAAASPDDTRRVLRGVLMSFTQGKLTMVATDGRRLAMVEHDVQVPQEAARDLILPIKVVSELQRSLGNDGDARITIENTQISFNLGDTRLYSKLLDEVYPNYRQVIPNEIGEKVTIDRQLLLSALERVSVMTVDESNSTRLRFASNELIVEANKSEAGSARDIVPIKYDAEPIEIVFNPNFVMDPLRAIDEDEITLNIRNSSSPAIMKCSVPFLYMMMPLRIG